jgi:tetratricopeptide (TPR) repeat protein
MDGRRLSWLVVGGLVAGAGCTRNTNPPGFVPPSPPPQASKSMFGGSSPPVASVPGMGPSGNGIPIEAAAPPRKSGQKGLLPDTETEFANTHVQVALGEPVPPNKDEMLDMARTRYHRALKQDPKHKGALLGLARMYVQTGERDKAAEAFKKYVEVHPKDAAVFHEAGMACARFQDWAGAVAWCEAALRLDPENRAYRKTIGFCLARAGRWEDAYGAMSQVMPEAQARYNMARVLEHMNQPAASRAQVELALRADPQHAGSREFLAELDQGYPAAAPAAANPIQTVGGTIP